MDTIALLLSIIGSLNWGLIGLFQFDLVAWLFGGQDALLSRIVYALVGLAGGLGSGNRAFHFLLLPGEMERDSPVGRTIND